MAMTIVNNNAASLVLGELNKNSNKLAKDLKKVSTGTKITSAGDGASEYAISERMRVMIRGLEQDGQNIQNSQALLRVAGGAIDNIIDELRNMKELALNAANDTNTDVDRATIQKEFDVRREGVNEIAIETTFNGKRLLDGSGVALNESLNLSPAEPTGSYTLTAADITADTITINSDGVYELDSSVVASYKGRKLTLQINATNVELKGGWYYSNYNYTDPSTFVDQGLFIICQQDDTNLWLNQFWAHNFSDNSIITFGKGTNNTLSVKDWASLHRSFDGRTVVNNETTASINIGGGLTILSAEGIGTSGLSTSSGLVVADHDYYARNYYSAGITTHAPLIGLDEGQSNSSANINAVTGAVTLIAQIDNVATALMGAGVGGNVGDIGIYDEGTVYAQIDADDTIDTNYILGAGYSGISGEVTYDSVVITATNKATFNGVSSLPTKKIYQNDFRIQHGTKANQNMLISIQSMKTDALGIDGTSVITRDKAVSAISDIDSAIEYALGQATQVGAYSSRLESTLSNVITATENVMSSESVIRDADMAKEMTSYTKNNVLLQSAQAMLTQANQSANSVLSLLQ